MSRKSLAMIVGVAITLLSALPVGAHIKPSGPPTLDTAYIVYHVKDDDKDYDSYETVTVTVGPYKVGDVANAGAGVRWPDQTDIAPVYLNNVDRGIEPSDCDQIHVDMNHATHGNDNFKFSYTVVLNFTDGTSFTYNHPNKETLTKDNGHGAWDDKKSS